MNKNKKIDYICENIRDMEEKSYFYIDRDGAQQGPRSLEQLKAINAITPSTMVWCQGMSDWQLAIHVGEFSGLFANIPPSPDCSYRPPVTCEPKPSTPTEPSPHTWLVESILSTFCCCGVTGIIGIIYASKVEGLWRDGRYEEARSASRTAKIMFIIGIIIGFFLVVTYIFFYVILGVTSINSLMMNY